MFTVKSYINPEQMRTDLTFSPNDLTAAMMNQASLFAHYGVLAAMCSKQVDTVEMLLETAEAAVDRKLRDSYAAKAEKFTEAQLNKEIARDSKILELKKALNEARQIESNAKIAVEAFRHRRDMLIQQGLLNREEMKGDMRLMEKNERERMLDDQKAAILARRREISGN